MLSWTNMQGEQASAGSGRVALLGPRAQGAVERGGLGPEERHDRGAGRGGDVQRAAVVGHHHVAAVEERHQLVDSDLTRQVDQPFAQPRSLHQRRDELPLRSATRSAPRSRASAAHRSFRKSSTWLLGQRRSSAMSPALGFTHHDGRSLPPARDRCDSRRRQLSHEPAGGGSPGTPGARQLLGFDGVHGISRASTVRKFARHVVVGVEGHLDVVQLAAPAALGAEAVGPAWARQEGEDRREAGEELEIQQQVVALPSDRPDGAQRGEQEPEDPARRGRS